MKEMLIGPLPPPYGGVSTHIMRLQKVIGAYVLQPKELRTWSGIKKVLRMRNTIIYLHTESWYVSLVIILKSIIYNRNCKYYYIKHNIMMNRYYVKSTKFKISTLLFRVFLKKCEKIFVVNPEVISEMKSMFRLKDIEIYDPFVKPNCKSESAILKSYEEDILRFINEHQPIISSCAWRLTFYKGVDLYGLDMLINLVKCLKETMPEIGFVFFISDKEYNQEYLSKCSKIINNYGINKQIKIVTGNKEFWPLLKRSDLFIRATNTDGDPLTIKEALFYNVKVLASDCTERKNGVILFKTRDFESLYENTIKALTKI